ncbi:Major facilitator superfamily domain-containing protein 6, partial [Pseudolycoriella hygida]
MKFQIDKEMLPMKAHYFFFNAGTSPVVPFMPTLIRQLGFSSFIVGTIYTILPIVGLLAKPIFGAIADRFQLQRMLFLIFQILTAVAFFGINFIPQLDHNASVSFHCNDGLSDLRYCPNGTADDCLVADLLRENADNTTYQLFNCDLTCNLKEKWMLDFICEKWQNNTDCDNNRKEFKIRTTQNLNHIERDSDDKDFCLHFLKSKAVLIDGENEHPIACPAEGGTSQYFKAECEGKCSNDVVMRTITETKINNSNVVNMVEFWLLLLFLTLSWAGMAVVVSIGDAICFSLLGERSHLYGSQRLWGSVGWGVFSVIAGLLVDKFSANGVNKNYSVVFYMVLVLLGLDFWSSLKIKSFQTQRSTSIMKDVSVLFLSLPVVIFFIWCIVIGVTFGLFYSTMTSYASIVAPVGTESTLQGLVGAIFEGVGVSAGSFVGGIMFERAGGSQTFQIYGIAVLVFCVIHIGLQKLLQRYSNLHDSRSGGAYYKTPSDALNMLRDEDHMPAQHHHINIKRNNLHVFPHINDVSTIHR